MIILYYSFILFSGLCLASFLPIKSTILKVALAPAFGIFLPCFIVYFCNLTGLPLSSHFIYYGWFPLASIVILIKRKEIFLVFNKFSQYYRSESLMIKVFIVVVIIGFIGMSARGYLTPMWNGDGYHHWAPKVIEWIQYQSLTYSPKLQHDLRLWVSYPLYHNIGMMINILSLPLPPAYSMKLFDVLHVWGLVAAAAFFLQNLGWDRRKIFLGALVVVFAQKDLLGFIISGYADLDVAYYYFLGGTLLLFSEKKISSSSQPHPYLNDILSGFLLGIMLITKNEGTYRLFFLFLVFHLIRWKGFLSWKRYAYIFAPIILLKVLDKLNAPVPYFVDYYYENLNFSITHLLSRASVIFQTSLYTFRPAGIFKSFWVSIILLNSLIFFRASRENWKHKNLFLTLLVLFVMNWIFDHIPCWISDPSNDPMALSKQVMGRLHIQFSTFLSMIGVVGIHQMMNGYFQRNAD